MAKLRVAYPQLFVTDMTASVAFYTGALGFSVAYLAGEPPFYAQLARDGVRLNLRHVDRMPFVTRVRRADELLSAYVATDEVDKLYDEFVTTGVSMAKALGQRPWGVTDFVIADPDGNLISFADR